MSGNVNASLPVGGAYATGPSGPGVTTTSLVSSIASNAPGVVQVLTPS